MATDGTPDRNFVEMDPKIFWQNLFATSSTQKHRIGTKRRLSDGREFIYGRAGAANLAAGVLVQAPTLDAANHANLVVAAANIADKDITVTLGNLLVTANMYAEGYLVINANTGAGYAYKIKSHPAAVANATLKVSLYDSLRIALDSTSNATLVQHPAARVIIHPSPPTQALVGATLGVVLANYYAWFQTKGPAAVLANGTLVVGNRAAPSASVDGAVSPVDMATANSNANAPGLLTQHVGKVITIGADAQYVLVDLNL